MSPSARSALRSSCQVFATWWWWSRCTLCVELSPTAPGTFGIGAHGFTWDHPTNSGVRTYIVDILIAHTQEASRIADLETFGDVRSKPKKRYVAVVIAARFRVCEAQSGTEVRGRTARRRKSMICIRSEAMPRTLHRRDPSYSVADIGKLIGSSRDPALGDLSFIKHLRCRFCCARRLVTSQAFAPACRRSTAPVTSAT